MQAESIQDLLLWKQVHEVIVQPRTLPLIARGLGGRVRGREGGVGDGGRPHERLLHGGDGAGAMGLVEGVGEGSWSVFFGYELRRAVRHV